MHDPEILLEMFIAAFLGIPTIVLCGSIAWKYRNDKHEIKLRSVALAMCIFVTISLIIFESIWICLYNGMKV